MSRADWHDRAACDGTRDPRFFPEEETMRIASDLERQYCRRCPVMVLCMGSALRNGDTGIFAGTTTAQRRKLARIRDRVKCPKCGCGKLVSVDVHDICAACGASWRTERKNEEGRDDGNDSH